jgi:hypothetical protein
MNEHLLGLFFALALLACVEKPESEGAQPWQPGTIYPSDSATHERGFIDLRGLIHAHSPYSHDACDGDPLVDGFPDPVCMADLRRGLCQSQHDFIMLTDHDNSGRDTDFKDLLLHQAAQGDILVERENAPVASWATCPDSNTRTLVMAGMEAGLMPVGLERHADISFDSMQTTEAVAAFKAAGAVVLLQHTEDWSVDQIVDLGVDGFEIFNLHANTLLAASTVFEMLLRAIDDGQGLPHPDLLLVPWISEDKRYLERWSQTLARGVRRVGTMGTDCHRNTFEAILADGERVDSYRRMMVSFSNHLLVRPESDGSWDDRAIKEALRAGRLYGVFEMLGYAQDFDFYAQTSSVIEMGEEVALGDAPKLVVRQPTLRQLDPSQDPPLLTTRILRATSDTWVEVATSSGDLNYYPSQAGAYRAEIRIRPRHLRLALGDYAQRSIDGDMVWLYANPIYVTN